MLVTERGLAATTVSAIARRAGVPTSAVYERFGDRDGCFVAFYRATTSYILEDIGALDRAQRDAGSDWQTRVREGARAYLAALAAEPALSQVAHLEIEGVGPSGRQARRDILDGYAQALQRLAAHSARNGDGVRVLDFDQALAAVGAMHELVLRHIELVGAERLIELHVPLSDVLVTMLEAR